MTNKEKLGLAFRILGLNFPNRVNYELARLAVEEKKKAELGSKLSCDDDHFDLEAPSLQNRLLDCLESKFGFRASRNHLQEANERRLEILRDIAKSALILNNEVKGRVGRFTRDFNDFELALLSEVIFDEDPSTKLKELDVNLLLMRKIKDGKGEGVIRYLAAGLEYAERRRNDGKGTLEGFNAVLLVATKMWTFPDLPFWLLPGAVAAKIIGQILERDFKKDAFNEMAKRYGLKRVPDRILNKFISPAQKDPECLALKEELEQAAGMSFNQARRGRPRGTSKCWRE